MQTTFLDAFKDPRMSFLVYVVWTVLLLTALGYVDMFDKQFFHLGPNTDEVQIDFFNKKIDTWNKVVGIWVIGFLIVVFKSYYHVIVKPWLTNQVYNRQVKRIGLTKPTTYLIALVDPLLNWINYIFLFFITLTMQLQFMLPQFLGEFIVNSVAVRAYLSEKTFKN